MVHACQMQNAMQHQYPDLVNALMSKYQRLCLGTVRRNRHLTQAAAVIARGE
jgi:hypothetical protein